VPAIRGDHIYTKAAQAATRSGRDKMNPTPTVGGGAGQWPEHYREDVAVAALHTQGVEPPRDTIARTIIDLAKTGERGPERLCEAALKASP
jgi:hypothetical protein